MARASRPENDTVADQVLDAPESTLLDLLDNLLNKGVMANGDVTLVDDPFDPKDLARAFDLEGQPSERLQRIKRGVAKAVVYDSGTAYRTQQKNTGHALPPNPFAPAAPMHLRLEPGGQTRDELIRSCKKGVLVTRFWYTRWVHQLRTIVTGMTRDGTFAIIDGEIA